MITFTHITSAEIVAQLDLSVAEEARYAASIAKIEREGIRYSNQDFDLLSGARAAIWRRSECVKLGISPDCTATEFWHAKERAA